MQPSAQNYRLLNYSFSSFLKKIAPTVKRVLNKQIQSCIILTLISSMPRSYYNIKARKRLMYD